MVYVFFIKAKIGMLKNFSCVFEYWVGFYFILTLFEFNPIDFN